MGKAKSLQELTLLDRFLFSVVMEDNETLEDVLEIILGYPVPLKDKAQAEKDLLKRTRYYNGMVDLNMLRPGEDYSKLKEAYIIMIMPFDLFGEGKYKYTFHMTCDEVPGLKLRDGATRIFLNTHGTNADGVSEELIQLLHYFERTTGEIAADSHSEKIEKLQKRVEQVKMSEEVGIRFMNAFEEKMMERREGGKKVWLRGEKRDWLKANLLSRRKLPARCWKRVWTLL